MPMFRRRDREVPQLNTTSTADISFMLLIFFLVTSSMDTDKGLPRQLPPPENDTEEQDQEVKSRNVLALRLDDADRLFINGQEASVGELPQRVAEFVANEANSPSLPEMSTRDVHLLGRTRVSDRHVITIEASRQTSYNAYFQMQNAIVAGYAALRDQLAMRRFSRHYADCSPVQRDVIALVYPQRISEAQPTGEHMEKGGAQ